MVLLNGIVKHLEFVKNINYKTLIKKLIYKLFTYIIIN